MNKFLIILKEIALYIWQLPQNILGLILLAIYRPETKFVASNGNFVYFASRMGGGISLGKYSIISSFYYREDMIEPLATAVAKHEAIGHGTQSRYLGPLYLPVVGLSSIIWAGLYGAVIPYTKNGYYKFWTEKWADKLGGVVR